MILDADGDVLTARPVTDPQFGKVTRTRGGRALQITDVPDNQTGSTSFTYEASDGKAVATARVNVTVHPWDMNWSEAASRSRCYSGRLRSNRVQHVD